MKPNSKPSGLDAPDFTQQRNADIQSAVTGLLAINGGGAVALLAFYQAVFKDNSDLAESTLYSMIWLVAGAAVATLVHMFRFHASATFQWSHNKKVEEDARRRYRNQAGIYRIGYIVCAYASLACFIIGLWVVIHAAFKLA